MDIETKALIYWVVVTGILWILARLQYYNSNTNLYWKYWVEEYGLGVWYIVVSRVGFFLFLAYYITLITIWWFKL